MGSVLRKQTLEPSWLDHLDATPDELLFYYGIGVPPVDVAELVSRLGIRSSYTSDPDILVRSDTRDRDGAIIQISKAGADSSKRIRLAHGLGHVLLHGPDMIFEHWRHDDIAGAEEKEVSKFAIDLLVPTWMLDPFVREFGGKTSRIARIFGVPERAIELRMRRLFWA